MQSAHLKTHTGDPATRVWGLDAARGIAVVGMLLLHGLAPNELASVPLLATLAGENRPQMLFAVIDGVCLGLLSGHEKERSAARRGIVVRAVALVALGLYLSSLNSGVVIILDYYGIYFILATPLLFLHRRTLLATSVVLALAGHGLVDFVFWFIGGVNAYFALPPIFHQPLEWLLFGPYPAATWLSYVLLGLWAQRAGLLSPRRNTLRVACALMVALCAGAAKSFTALAPWMQATLVDLAAGAAAISVVWTSVYVFEYVSRHVPTLVIRASVCLGVVPLSSYVLHVMLLACVAAAGGVSSTRSIETYVLISVACVSFALIAATSRVRGPIEAGVAWLASSAARGRGPARCPAGSPVGVTLPHCPR